MEEQRHDDGAPLARESEPMDATSKGQQVGGPQRWPLASLSDNHHGHHSPAQPPPPTTDALVAAAAAAAASLADDQALVAAAAAGLAPQLPLPLQQQPLHLANGAAPSAGGAGHPPQGAAPHLSGKSQAPTSFTIVQEKLLVPRRLCQAHMPEMVVDNTTVFMRLLTMQCGANGQCLSMSRERVQLTFKANHSYIPLVGADTTSVLGKRILGWSVVTADSGPDLHATMVNGQPHWLDPGTGMPLPLSTDKLLVLEVEWSRSPSSSATLKGQAAVAARPVVAGTPLFVGSRRVGNTSCTHCGAETSTVWRRGWTVPVIVGNGRQAQADVNLCNGCGIRYAKNPGAFRKSIARTTGSPTPPDSEDDMMMDENAHPGRPRSARQQSLKSFDPSATRSTGSQQPPASAQTKKLNAIMAAAAAAAAAAKDELHSQGTAPSGARSRRSSGGGAAYSSGPLLADGGDATALLTTAAAAPKRGPGRPRGSSGGGSAAGRGALLAAPGMDALAAMDAAAQQQQQQQLLPAVFAGRDNPLPVCCAACGASAPCPRGWAKGWPLNAAAAAAEAAVAMGATASEPPAGGASHSSPGGAVPPADAAPPADAPATLSQSTSAGGGAAAATSAPSPAPAAAAQGEVPPESGAAAPAENAPEEAAPSQDAPPPPAPPTAVPEAAAATDVLPPTAAPAEPPAPAADAAPAPEYANLCAGCGDHFSSDPIAFMTHVTTVAAARAAAAHLAPAAAPATSSLTLISESGRPVRKRRPPARSEEFVEPPMLIPDAPAAPHPNPHRVTFPGGGAARPPAAAGGAPRMARTSSGGAGAVAYAGGGPHHAAAANSGTGARHGGVIGAGAEVSAGEVLGGGAMEVDGGAAFQRAALEAAAQAKRRRRMDLDGDDENNGGGGELQQHPATGTQDAPPECATGAPNGGGAAAAGAHAGHNASASSAMTEADLMMLMDEDSLAVAELMTGMRKAASQSMMVAAPSLLQQQPAAAAAGRAAGLPKPRATSSAGSLPGAAAAAAAVAAQLQQQRYAQQPPQQQPLQRRVSAPAATSGGGGAPAAGPGVGAVSTLPRQAQHQFEIPIVGNQPLIVPDGLVQRHFSMALDPQQACTVRLVFMCGSKYILSGMEWVRLRQNTVTKQVHVESAHLPPLFGKVMVGWRALDPDRAPGPYPFEQSGHIWWQEPSTSQVRPLSTSKVLVLEVREPALAVVQPPALGPGHHQRAHAGASLAPTVGPPVAHAPPPAQQQQQPQPAGAYNRRVMHPPTAAQAAQAAAAAAAQGKQLLALQQQAVVAVAQQVMQQHQQQQQVAAAAKQAAQAQQQSQQRTPHIAMLGAGAPAPAGGVQVPANIQVGPAPADGNVSATLHLTGKKFVAKGGKQLHRIRRHLLFQQQGGAGLPGTAAAAGGLLPGGSDGGADGGSGSGSDEADNSMGFAARELLQLHLQQLATATGGAATAAVQGGEGGAGPEAAAPQDDDAAAAAAAAAAVAAAATAGGGSGAAPPSGANAVDAARDALMRILGVGVGDAAGGGGGGGVPPPQEARQGSPAADAGDAAAVLRPVLQQPSPFKDYQLQQLGGACVTATAAEGGEGGAPARAGSEGPVPGQGEGAEGDAAGAVLDLLRPIVLGLRQCGGPSVSSVWMAISKMTPDQVKHFQRHGLPWVDSLWGEQQHDECARLLKQMLGIPA